jgi:hypothetical protein
MFLEIIFLFCGINLLGFWGILVSIDAVEGLGWGLLEGWVFLVG